MIFYYVVLRSNEVCSNCGAQRQWTRPHYQHLKLHSALTLNLRSAASHIAFYLLLKQMTKHKKLSFISGGAGHRAVSSQREG